MKHRGLILSLLIVAAVAMAVGVGVWTLVAETSTAAHAGPCRCPQIYAPVTCDNGKTYPNQCVADCRNADNCVPTGGL